MPASATPRKFKLAIGKAMDEGLRVGVEAGMSPTDVAERVVAAIKARRTLTETLATVGNGPGDWLLFDQFHRRNVTAAYAELEWDD